MKDYSIPFLIIGILLFVSCQNPKDKPVIETLSVDEISSLINKDDMYKSVIKDVESVREKLEKDLVTKSKFKDLTYFDYYIYSRAIIDARFDELVDETVNSYIEQHLNRESDSLLSIYQTDIDKIYNYFKEKYQTSNFTQNETRRDLFWGGFVFFRAFDNQSEKNVSIQNEIINQYRSFVENNMELSRNDYLNIIYKIEGYDMTYDQLIDDARSLASMVRKKQINENAYQFECLINGVEE